MTAAAMRLGCMCRRASTASTLTPGTPRVSASSSRASAPQPMTTTRGGMVGTAASGDAGTALVDEAPGRLRGHAGIAAVGIRADRHAEFLVEWRAADEDDVVIAHAAVLERLDDDLHVRHRRGEQRTHAQDVRLV